MIDAEALRGRPRQKEKVPPALTDKQVKEIIVANVEEACAITHKIRGMAESVSDASKGVFLFAMKAEDDESIVENGNNVGLCARGRVQEIAFEVMTQYGLNAAIHHPINTDRGWDSNGIHDYKDGTSRELLVYPSQTVRGLSFERDRYSYTSTGESIIVTWSVEGQKRPFREKLKNLFSNLIRGVA